MKENALLIPIPLELLPQPDDPPNVAKLKRTLIVCGFLAKEACEVLGLSSVQMTRLLKHPMMGNWWEIVKIYRFDNQLLKYKNWHVENMYKRTGRQVEPIETYNHHYALMDENSRPEDFAHLIKKKSKVRKPSRDVASKYVDLPLP